MLPTKLRLKTSRVKQLLYKGLRNGNHYFNLKFSATNNKASRFCVIVSAKIYPKAVDRNRLRRQLYEIIRLNKELLIKNFDIILIAKPSIKDLSFQTLKTLIIKSFKIIK